MTYWFLEDPHAEAPPGVGGFVRACAHCRRPRKRKIEDLPEGSTRTAPWKEELSRVAHVKKWASLMILSLMIFAIYDF